LRENPIKFFRPKDLAGNTKSVSALNKKGTMLSLKKKKDIVQKNRYDGKKLQCV